MCDAYRKSIPAVGEKGWILRGVDDKPVCVGMRLGQKNCNGMEVNHVLS